MIPAVSVVLPTPLCVPAMTSLAPMIRLPPALPFGSRLNDLFLP